MNDKKLEKIAKDIFREAQEDGEPVTMEEAIEMAKMEINYTESRHYEQASVERASGDARKRKIDADKKLIFDTLRNSIEPLVTINGNKNEVELNFTYNGFEYTMKLTKHKKK